MCYSRRTSGLLFFFFSSRRRHTRLTCDWSSDVCSSDLHSFAFAAHEAYLQLSEKGVAGRVKVVQIVKDLCTANAKEWGRIELEETKIGQIGRASCRERV